MPSKSEGEKPTAKKSAAKKTKTTKAKTTKAKATKKTATKAKSAAKKTTATKAAKTTEQATPAAKAAGGEPKVRTLRVRQVRSTVRGLRTFKRTLEAMGIRHHQDEVVVRDTPAMQGMLRKVRHLVRVTPEE